MVEIGGKPILWHIMNIYGATGINEFIIALGYRGEIIKEYFLNFYALNNNLTLDMAAGKTTIHDGNHPTVEGAPRRHRAGRRKPAAA